MIVSVVERLACTGRSVGQAGASHTLTKIGREVTLRIQATKSHVWESSTWLPNTLTKGVSFGVVSL